MEIHVRIGNLLQESAALCMFGLFEDLPMPAEIAGLLEPGDFRARAGQTLLLYPRGVVSPRRLLLVGMGKVDAVNADSVRRAGALAMEQARTLQVESVTVGVSGATSLAPDVVAQAFTEGIMLGSYRFWRYRTGLRDEDTFAVAEATIYLEEEREGVTKGVATGQIVARGVTLARDLVNGPGYAMTPAALAEEAVALGNRSGIRVTVFDKARLEQEGFGGILAVGRGSTNEPRFIIMEYGEAGAGTPTICLVGKGLTFDSGGLSLKPADAMETMKGDMGGSAAVVGAMQTVAELGLPLHVVGLISAAENMPSSDAYRPGDVIKTLSGKTVEVLNTDAEGRIILSDALFYAQRYNPAAIIELSTLTGAIIIALGTQTTGMMATDQALADQVRRAGEITGERVWELPLWDIYHEMVKSDIADLKNMAGRPAGSITAGAFLAAFVGEYPFVHLDIAGSGWVDRPGKPYESRGGTGVGVRLLTQFLIDYTR